MSVRAADAKRPPVSAKSPTSARPSLPHASRAGHRNHADVMMFHERGTGRYLTNVAAVLLNRTAATWIKTPFKSEMVPGAYIRFPIIISGMPRVFPAAPQRLAGAITDAER